MEIEKKQYTKLEGSFCFCQDCKGINYKTEEESTKCSRDHAMYLFKCQDMYEVAQAYDEKKISSRRKLERRLELMMELLNSIQCDLKHIFFVEQLPQMLQSNIKQANIFIFNNLRLREEDDQDFSEDGRVLDFKNQKTYIRKVLEQIADLQSQATSFTSQLKGDEEDALEVDDELYFSKKEYPFNETSNMNKEDKQSRAKQEVLEKNNQSPIKKKKISKKPLPQRKQELKPQQAPPSFSSLPELKINISSSSLQSNNNQIEKESTKQKQEEESPPKKLDIQLNFVAQLPQKESLNSLNKSISSPSNLLNTIPLVQSNSNQLNQPSTNQISSLNVSPLNSENGGIKNQPIIYQPNSTNSSLINQPNITPLNKLNNDTPINQNLNFQKQLQEGDISPRQSQISTQQSSQTSSQTQVGTNYAQILNNKEINQTNNLRQQPSLNYAQISQIKPNETNRNIYQQNSNMNPIQQQKQIFLQPQQFQQQQQQQKQTNNLYPSSSTMFPNTQNSSQVSEKNFQFPLKSNKNPLLQQPQPFQQQQFQPKFQQSQQQQPQQQQQQFQPQQYQQQLQQQSQQKQQQQFQQPSQQQTLQKQYQQQQQYISKVKIEECERKVENQIIQQSSLKSDEFKKNNQELTVTNTTKQPINQEVQTNKILTNQQNEENSSEKTEKKQNEISLGKPSKFQLLHWSDEMVVYFKYYSQTVNFASLTKLGSEQAKSSFSINPEYDLDKVKKAEVKQIGETKFLFLLTTSGIISVYKLGIKDKKASCENVVAEKQFFQDFYCGYDIKQNDIIYFFGKTRDGELVIKIFQNQTFQPLLLNNSLFLKNFQIVDLESDKNRKQLKIIIWNDGKYCLFSLNEEQIPEIVFSVEVQKANSIPVVLQNVISQIDPSSNFIFSEKVEGELVKIDYLEEQNMFLVCCKKRVFFFKLSDSSKIILLQDPDIVSCLMKGNELAIFNADSKIIILDLNQLFSGWFSQK